ncbi:MAG: DNA/RNA non-specific endonuclease [Bacteroidota bacterium]
MNSFRRLFLPLMAAMVIFFLQSCQEIPTESPQTNPASVHQHSLKKVTVSEDFEAGTKTSYATGDVTFASGVWTLNDALVGTSSSDIKNGTKSVRTRNSGKVTMKFNRTDGASVVTVKHAKYGTDGNSTWQLWYSTNSGSTWVQTGSTITTSSTTLSTASFTVNVTGTIRFEIRKTDGTANRINFDDFVINDYVVTPFENFETGTKTSYAAANVTLASGVWNLNDALLGTSSSDRKNGTQSVRTRNSGKVTMMFDKATGAGTVSILHAKYGTDGNSTWQLWYSTNSGSTWVQTGSTVTTSSTTLSTASFTVNVGGSIRFEIRKTDGTTTRINFDDVVINDYAGSPSVTEVEPNNTTASANAITTVPSTQTGLISTTTDVDFFSLTASSAQTITLGLTVPSGVNYDLHLVNSTGTVVASSTNGTGLAENISYNSTTTETYYVEILSTSGSSTTTTYSLSANVTTTGGGGGTDTSSSVHLTMGNPSGAVADVNVPTNYLMEKPQYVLSYHRDKGEANWVAWHLNASWLGSTPRQDDFRADNTLPAGWYQVQSTSYSGSGYDRGHMCPSADRTATVEDNSATFLMTNMIPQAPNNNQGPWASMENYLRSLVTAGNELYIYSGGYGSQGTIDNGHVNVPTRTWKVVVVLPEGNNDLSRVTTSTRVIAVDMPNNDALISRTADWKTFRVSIDAVEAATGYDFLSKVSPSIQAVIEATVDNQ